MKRRIVVVGLLLAVALVMPVRLQAHQGHKVVGIVTGIDASHLEVKDRAGKTMSISLTGDTKYRKAGATAGASAQAAGADDVKVGQRVAVSVMHEGEKMTATLVTLGVEGSGGGQGKPHAQQH